MAPAMVTPELQGDGMTTLLTFPAPRAEDRIPTPFNHREGDSYVRLSFEDAPCPPPGFSFTVVFVARLGSPVSDALHILGTPEGALLASLVVQADDRINVLSFSPEFPSRIYAREELDVLGPVVEIWPRGFNGHRYVLNPTLPDAEALRLPLALLSN